MKDRRGIQESGIVGTDIDHDGYDSRWIDSSSERIDVSFSDTDQDSSDSLISDTQDTFRVRNDNKIDLSEART